MTELNENIIKIYDKDHLPVESLGGKADGLFYLLGRKLNVPEFYVLPDEILQRISKKELTTAQIIAHWVEKFSPDPDALWSVRSSAEVEDGTERSYAGLFTSVLNTRIDQLPSALEKVMKGFEEAKSSNYHQGDDFGCNVVVQQMVDADYSGVGFSTNPMDYESDNPLLNIIPGMGSKLVSGEANSLILEVRETNEALLLTHDKHFKGQRFSDGGHEEMEASTEKIVHDLEPVLEELRNMLLAFEKDKGHPVDTEFSIKDGKVYWLQIRPVTSFIPKGIYIVWDNSNSVVNYPGIVMPLTSSFVLYTYSNAYRTMFRYLGAGSKFIKQNESYFSTMLSAINGALYYNITAWQTILYQMPFGKKTSKLIAKMFGAEKAKFEKPKAKSSFFVLFRLFGKLIYSMLFFNKLKKRYLQFYQEVQDGFQRERLRSLTHEELIFEFRTLEKKLADQWFPPMINGFFTMISYNGLQKILNGSRLSEDYPNFLNDALTGDGDVVSVKIVRSLQQLQVDIYAHHQAREIIMHLPIDGVLNELKKSCPQIWTKIETYLNEFGERCEEGELKIETVNYLEDPQKFIEFLRVNLKHEPELKKGNKPFDPMSVIDRHYRWNVFKRSLLKILVRFTIRRVKDRENFRFIRTRTFNITRSIFRSMDSDLLTKGWIKEKNDSLYLTFEEIMDPSKVGQYRSIIESRKNEYSSYNADNIPARYYQIEGKFYPAVKNNLTFSGDDMKGIGCSSGTRQGQAVIVTADNLNMIEVEGKILVATYFEPGWIGLFSRCAGLISERGSLLSHTSILCREMGIPAIVGAKNILDRLKGGEMITMNGATGSIEIIENELV